MPRKDRPTRVERGLYRSGKTFLACATHPGSRQAVWKTLGEIGIMEARRRRDEFVVEVRQSEGRVRQPKLKLRDVAEDWLEDQRARVAVGDLRPRTLEIYEQGLRLHASQVPGGGVRGVGLKSSLRTLAAQAAWSSGTSSLISLSM
jgi:hypothetical protein